MRPRCGAPTGGAVAGLLVLAVLSCAGQGFVHRDLDGRHPGLSGADARRLSAGHPYLLPTRGELLAVTCRWPDGQAVPVRIGAGVDPRTGQLVERAARAWESLLGIRLPVSRAPETRLTAAPGIDVEVVGPEDRRVQGAGTIADCRVEPDALRAGRSGPSSARLVSATVTLRPVARDFVGRSLELPEDSLLGAALHELGHALGFQGHVRERHSVMVRSVDDVQFAGRRLLAGHALRDDAVSALYRLPPGSTLARAPLTAEATRELDVLTARGGALGLGGPFLRSGDRAALVFWRDGAGRSVGFAVDDLPSVLADPSALELRALPGTRRRVRELETAADRNATDP